jgi:hypothetical protein
VAKWLSVASMMMMMMMMMTIIIRPTNNRQPRGSADAGRKSIERHLIAAAVVSETGSTGLRAWYLVRVLPAPPRSPTFAERSRLTIWCKHFSQ